MSAEKRMFRKIAFLGIGVLSALFIFDNVLNSTGDSSIAIIAFVSVLAFWIGTLKVIFKVKVTE